MMADDRRQQLADDVAAVLAEHRVRTYPTDDGGVRLSVTPHAEVAALLLPLLDRVAADAAAEALISAGNQWRYLTHDSAPVVRFLRDRAAELRAPARTDEEN